MSSGSVVAVQERRELVPMTAMDLLTRRELVQRVIEEVMVEGVHYGIIPGTTELSLLKEGAEVLLSTFHIAVEPIVTDLSTSAEVRFRVECRGIHMGTNGFVGAGVGVCTSNEEKYRWRKCRSNAEYENVAPEHRRIKYGRSKSGQEYQDKQVRASPWDVYHTIMSMATKRGMVALAKTALAASECLKRAKMKRPPVATPPKDPGFSDSKAGTTPKAEKGPDKSRPATSPASTPAQASAPVLITQEQLHTLMEQIDQSGIPENAFLARFEIGRIEELEALRFGAAQSWIRSNLP